MIEQITGMRDDPSLVKKVADAEKGRLQKRNTDTRQAKIEMKQAIEDAKKRDTARRSQQTHEQIGRHQMFTSTKRRVKAEKPPAEPPQIVKDYWMFLGEIAGRLLAEDGDEL